MSPGVTQWSGINSWMNIVKLVSQVEVYEEVGNISFFHGKGFHFLALDPATFHAIGLQVI